MLFFYILTSIITKFYNNKGRTDSIGEGPARVSVRESKIFRRIALGHNPYHG